MHPYSSIDTTAAWKKLGLILSVWSDFHTIDRLSVAVHTFADRSTLCNSVSDWAGAFARIAMSSALLASVIVFAGYLLLLSFISLKLFSLILSINSLDR